MIASHFPLCPCVYVVCAHVHLFVEIHVRVCVGTCAHIWGDQSLQLGISPVCSSTIFMEVGLPVKARVPKHLCHLNLELQADPHTLSTFKWLSVDATSGHPAWVVKGFKPSPAAYN